MYYTAYQNNLFSIKITYSYLYYQRSPGSEVSAKTSLIDIKLVLESQYSLNLQHGTLHLEFWPTCQGVLEFNLGNWYQLHEISKLGPWPQTMEHLLEAICQFTTCIHYIHAHTHTPKPRAYWTCPSRRRHFQTRTHARREMHKHQSKVTCY